DEQGIVAIDQLGQAGRCQRLVAAREATELTGDHRRQHAEEAKRKEGMIADELGQTLQDFGHDGDLPDGAHTLCAGMKWAPIVRAQGLAGKSAPIRGHAALRAHTGSAQSRPQCRWKSQDTVRVWSGSPQAVRRSLSTRL